MIRTAFVSIGIGGRYQTLAQKQRESFIRVAPSEHLIQFIDRLPEGAPKNLDLPYLAYCAKPFAMAEAARDGFEFVVWIDSSVTLATSPIALQNFIADCGHYVQANWWDDKRQFNVGEWCSDAALANLKITREHAFDIPEISTMCLGLDMRQKDSQSFLREWKSLASDGVTFIAPHTNDIGPAKEMNLAYRAIGPVSKDSRVLGHRHDQTAASVLAYRRGWQGIRRPIFAEYFRETRDPRTILVNKG